MVIKIFYFKLTLSVFQTVENMKKIKGEDFEGVFLICELVKI